MQYFIVKEEILTVIVLFYVVLYMHLHKHINYEHMSYAFIFKYDKYYIESIR